MTREEAEKEIRDNFTKVWADGIIKALEQEPIIDVNVPHKIAEFFSNWDGDENAKMNISVNDMREIADIFREKVRAEWQLNKIRQEQQPKIGHWIGISQTGYTGKNEKLKYNEWECSECGMEVSNDYMDFDYCPYCRAKMIEKGETNNDVQC